jgi:branched-chain amino acid transport system substrate-binding protein
MRRKNLYLILFSLVLAMFFLVACSKQEKETSEDKSNDVNVVEESDDTYKIAVVAPQIGPYQALGLSIVRGAELAVSIKNDNGGIDGKNIELIKVDDGEQET